MVEIIAFPGKSHSTTVDTSRLNLEGQQLAQDGQVLPVPQISSTLDGTVVVSPGQTAETFPEGDWTNQELADLYRVESLLVQAGIKMSTGRGVTDEDDPWFVFCREDGDVFVHLARADGRYLLDSPGLSGLLEGPDFATLIDTFVKQLAALRAPEDDSNVVSFRPKMLRDKSVHLHPSILLAALIWTLYLASDDIASATEAASDLAEDMILPVDKLLTLDSDTAPAPGAAVDAFDGTGTDDELVKTSTGPQNALTSAAFADADRSASSSDRLVSSFGAMVATASPAAQAVSASLAIIAFSFGFYGPQSGNDPDGDTGSGFSIAGLHSALRELADSVSSSARIQADRIAGNIETELDAGPVVLEDLDGKNQVAVADVVDFELHLKDLAAEASGHGLPDLDVPVEETAAQTSTTEEATSGTESTAYQGGQDATPSKTEEPAAAAKEVQGDIQKTVQANVTAEPASEPETVVTTLLSSHMGSGSSYDICGTTVSATLDAACLEKLLGELDNLVIAEPVLDLGSEPVSNPDTVTAATSDLNPALKEPATLEIDAPVLDLDAPAETPVQTPADVVTLDQPERSVVGAEIDTYDTRVDNFITSFIHNSEQVEIVHFQTELVIIDMSAIGDSSSHTYARSWVTDEGHVISTIGSYQDFLDYGMA